MSELFFRDLIEGTRESPSAARPPRTSPRRGVTRNLSGCSSASEPPLRKFGAAQYDSLRCPALEQKHRLKNLAARSPVRSACPAFRDHTGGLLRGATDRLGADRRQRRQSLNVLSTNAPGDALGYCPGRATLVAHWQQFVLSAVRQRSGYLPLPRHAPLPPMIQSHHLSRSYGPKLALSDLTLRVEPGEILGFLGPNGAGKSTTVKILTGMIRPTSGRASVGGFDIVEQPIEAKKKFGYVPESAAIYDGLTAAEYLELVACLHHLDARVAEARRHELLELFDLLDVQDQRLTEFSKGMRQKVLLASALLHRPDVLFLDEPLDGLDANAARVVKEVLKQLAAQGKTILFCSHILDVVERICTRIVIINNGQQIANGTSAQIRQSTGTASLEQAFSKLTGVRDVGTVAAEFLAALEKA